MIITGMGRLGRDVELRYLQDGTPVVNLALAFNYGLKDAEGQRPSQWLEASLFGKRAESMAPYLTKGQPLVVVVDDPHIETFTRRDQTIGHKLTGRVLTLEFCGSKPAAESTAANPAPTPTSAPQPGAAASNYDYDDDIPF